MTQRGMTDQPVRLVTAGDPPTLLVNRDLVSQVLVGSDTGIINGNPNGVSVIDPLGSIATTGEEDVWGIRAPGSTTNPNVDALTSVTAWSASPAQIAAQITLNGVSLLANPVNLYTGSNSIASGGSATLSPINPSPVAGYANANQIGYEVSFSATNAVAGTNPFARVRITFYDEDDPAAQPVDDLSYYIPISTNGSPVSIVYGHGPMRGLYIKVVVSIPLAGAGNSTITTRIRGVGRDYPRDDWRELLDPIQTKPGYTNPTTNADGGSGVLFSISNTTSPTLSILAAGSTSRLLPLYSGRIKIRMVVSGLTTDQMTFSFIPVNTANNAGGLQNNALDATSLGSATHSVDLREEYFPHDSILLTIVNNSAANGLVAIVGYMEEY